MTSSIDNNKRIAKNTLLLYIRMAFSMIISLYTSRVILNTLGIQDFGIYDVVGGVIILFGFFNGALSTATQRFLNYELGTGNTDSVQRVFSASMSSYLLLILIILLLSETIGLWFLNNRINISVDRLFAANWVYQFSIITFCINILRVPYNATIIAFENMSFYAYFSLIEVLLKLGIVYLLLLFNTDKLILYSFLVLIVSVFILISYKIYCNKLFPISKYKLCWDSSFIKKIISFSGFSLLGSTAGVASSQGTNILLNLFYGVTINGTMGIANQVRGAVFQFISNFQIAFNPQIVKSYATNDKTYFMSLLFRASKFSFLLMFIIAIPILLNIDFILSKWLITVPVYANIFCQIGILSLLIDSLGAPLGMSVQATGNIKKYQIYFSILTASTLPLSYFALKLGSSPPQVLIISLFINLITFIWRVFFLKRHINMSIVSYIKEVFIPCFITILFTLPLPLYLKFSIEGNKLSTVITISLSFFIISLPVILFCALKNKERDFLRHAIMSKLYCARRRNNDTL